MKKILFWFFRDEAQGFLTIAFENHSIVFPSTINMCTSLLARALIATTNHKLQTLVKELEYISVPI